MDRSNLEKWLELPAGLWPPNYFALLGLEKGAGSTEEIEKRVFDRMELLRTYQLRYPDEVTDGMNLLAQAMVCLCDPDQRENYERTLGLAKAKPPLVRSAPVVPEIPVAVQLPEKKKKRDRIVPPSPEKQNGPLPVAKAVAQNSAITKTAQIPLLRKASRNARRRMVQKQVFVRRLAKNLRQLLDYLDESARIRELEREKRELQATCQAINRLWASPFWSELGWEGHGERLLSITKILARYPSIDLVANQIENVSQELTRTIRKLEEEKAVALEDRLARRERRRHRRRFRRMKNDILWHPEKIVYAIALLTVAIALFRWLISSVRSEGP